MGAHCGSKSNKQIKECKYNCEPSGSNNSVRGKKTDKVDAKRKFNVSGSGSKDARLANVDTKGQIQIQQPSEQTQPKSLAETSVGGVAGNRPKVLGETDHISSDKAMDETAAKKMVRSHPQVQNEELDVGENTLNDKQLEKQTIGPRVKTVVEKSDKNTVDSTHVFLDEKSEVGVSDLNDQRSEEHNLMHSEETVQLRRITRIEQMRAICRKFDKIDTNSDGRLSEKEFVSALELTNTADLDPKDFSDIANGKEFITREDFTQFYISKTWDAIISDFMEMDVKGEQKVSKEVFIDSCKSKQNLCSEYQAELLFKKLDVNGDEELSFEEFRGGMEQEYIVRTLERFIDFGDVQEIRDKNKGTHHLLFPQCCPPEKVTKFHVVYEDGVAKLKNATIMEAFNQINWDMNNERVITIMELTKYFSQQGVSKSDCENLFHNFDENGDDVINYKEFKNYFLRSARQLD